MRAYDADEVPFEEASYQAAGGDDDGFVDVLANDNDYDEMKTLEVTKTNPLTIEANALGATQSDYASPTNLDQ